MALKPDLIEFFLRNIQSASVDTFGSEVAQLFGHLDSEIKDNPVFNKYEEERINWEGPSTTRYRSWKFPSNFDDAKSFVYGLYRTIGESDSAAVDLPMTMTHVNHGDLNDDIDNFNSHFLEYFEQVLMDIINANPEYEIHSAEKVSGNTVFIIHGHDDGLKTDVQLLLTRAGVNNIVLHEQADKGRTIIDKLVEESSSSNYAIALLSPDDILQDGTERARQNVILEIGYFIGRLGKERVRLIKKGSIEIPSDLSGILYENYDSAGAWKMKLCKELIAVGIYVDMEAVTNKL